jgi:putative PIG3 family NAD(P)H quinone oxidoreductase
VKAVVLRGHGGTEVLGFEDVPDPVAGPDEIVVRVASAALNRADLMQRMGLYPDPFPGAHEIPGLEYAGTVESCGTRVTLWQPGDRVMGIVSGGAQAEKVVVHERQAMAVPAGMTLLDAGGVPEVFLTAWDALVLQGGLTSGRWALVHAGASGVGTAAIQVAKAVGARVIATCSAGKVQACRDLGADAVVDYGAEDFVAVAARVTGGAGVDVVLDVVGGDYTERNVAALAVQGRIIQVGLLAGRAGTFNVGLLLPKRASIIGTVLRPRPLEEKIALTRRFAAEMLPLFDTGALRPVIDSVVPVADIAAAHERLAANASVGKIVLAFERGAAGRTDPVQH